MPSISESRRFRLKILACMLKPRFMARYHHVIKPEYFEQEDEHTVCQILQFYWEKFRHSPAEDDLVDLMDGQYINTVRSIYLGLVEWDLDYPEDRAIQFAREQAAKAAVLESVDNINKGDLDVVIDRLKEATLVGQDLADTGIDLKDTSAWIHLIEGERIPTGMIHLDIAMGGGLESGELGVFLAPPNYGKSMALVNVGYGAAGPISECNVAHFSLEMAAHTVAKRYAARMLFRFPSRDGDNTKYEYEFENYTKALMPGNVRIFRVSGSVAVLRSRLNILEDSDYHTDLLIVDYGDELQPTRSRNQHWIELGDIFHELRELGHEFGCPVWTATQANRSSLGKQVITMADLAESFQKAAKADAIVALCQTPEEEDSQQCRLFLAKLRDGESRSMIQAKYYKKSQAIITTGFTKSHLEPDKEEL